MWIGYIFPIEIMAMATSAPDPHGGPAVAFGIGFVWERIAAGLMIHNEVCNSDPVA